MYRYQRLAVKRRCFVVGVSAQSRCSAEEVGRGGKRLDRPDRDGIEISRDTLRQWICLQRLALRMMVK